MYVFPTRFLQAQANTSFAQLVMQMFAALNYIQTQHPPGDIPGQPNQRSQAENDVARKDSTDPSRTVSVIVNGNSGQSSVNTETTTAATSQETFRAALRELAQDLVMQEQKTEILINSLPGLGTSERDQRRRMQELEHELEEVEAERLLAEKDKTDMLRSLDRLIIGLGRGR